MKLLLVSVMLLLGFVFSVFAAPPDASSIAVRDDMRAEPRAVNVAGIDLQDMDQASAADRAELVPQRAVDRTPWLSAVVFYALGLVGMGAHYAKKWARGQYAGNLWAYLFADNPRASLAAVLTYTAAAAGVMATGSIDGMTLAQVAALGFGTGYVSDSAVNAA